MEPTGTRRTLGGRRSTAAPTSLGPTDQGARKNSLQKAGERQADALLLATPEVAVWVGGFYSRADAFDCFGATARGKSALVKRRLW
jgi:hypothetical protein